MLRADGTFPHDQANVMKIFYGGKIIAPLCQSTAHLQKMLGCIQKYYATHINKNTYFCMLFVNMRI